MLIDFSVENYLSIKERLTFSMIASDDETESTIKNHKVNDYLTLLPAATIYGFNASGKTNLIKAMHLIKKQIVYSKLPDLSIIDTNVFEYTPFKLDDTYLGMPTNYQLRVSVDDNIYDYRISCDCTGILNESLIEIKPDDSYTELLNRTNDLIELDYEIDLDIVEKIAGPNIKYKALVGILSIFDDRISRFYNWVENDFIILKNSFEARENIKKTTEHLLDKDKKFHVKLLRMLNDISYSNINQICAENIPDSLNHDDLDEIVKSKIKKFASTNSTKPFVEFDDLTEEDYTLNTFKQGYDVLGNERDVVFNLFEESEGTIKIYALYAYIYEALYYGKTLVIDEMTSYIHPLISQYILDLFQNPVENMMGQLITSTHTTDLLEMKSLRRDQVYIADKDFNETKLYSLSDIYDVSKSENFRYAYLSGKYGGLNYFRRELYE